MGRKEAFAIVQSKRDEAKKLVWFHAASLGEFEQGRPLLEKIKIQYPDYQILLTFFSSSGYEIRKNYQHADIICYLPIDSLHNATKFIEAARPDMVFFIKYEFWFNFLEVLTQKNIKTYYIAALFRENQYFFNYNKNYFLPILKKINHFFVQNEESKMILQSVGIAQVSVIGDPRIDRVVAIAQNPNHYKNVAFFIKNFEEKTMIIGSSWAQDEAILMPFINHNKDWKFIIAPHEIKEKKIQNIEKQCFRKIIRYSELEKITDVSVFEVLLIDNIGMLSSLYQYGKIAYIGGGFGAGIHNTLEPMAFNLPVVFGPKFQKFDEAITTVASQANFTIQNKNELDEVFLFLKNEKNYEKTSEKVKDFMRKNNGATDAIFDAIKIDL